MSATDRDALLALVARFGLGLEDDVERFGPNAVVLPDDPGPPGYYSLFQFDADGKFVSFGVTC